MTWTKEEQADHRRLWVEALRSGKYCQGHGVLRRGDRYCCLGVACDISGLSKWEVDEEAQDDPMSYDGAPIRLPAIVQNWLGMADGAGTIRGRGSSLIAMNDLGASFTEIANFIESKPYGMLEEG